MPIAIKRAPVKSKIGHKQRLLLRAITDSEAPLSFQQALAIFRRSSYSTINAIISLEKRGLIPEGKRIQTPEIRGKPKFGPLQARILEAINTLNAQGRNPGQKITVKQIQKALGAETPPSKRNVLVVIEGMRKKPECRDVIEANIESTVFIDLTRPFPPEYRKLPQSRVMILAFRNPELSVEEIIRMTGVREPVETIRVWVRLAREQLLKAKSENQQRREQKQKERMPLRKTAASLTADQVIAALERKAENFESSGRQKEAKQLTMAIFVLRRFRAISEEAGSERNTTALQNAVEQARKLYLKD